MPHGRMGPNQVKRLRHGFHTFWGQICAGIKTKYVCRTGNPRRTSRERSSDVLKERTSHNEFKVSFWTEAREEVKKKNNPNVFKLQSTFNLASSARHTCF